MDLSEFLLARIAEDEDIARRAAGPVWVMGVDREGGPGRWRHVAQLVALPVADPTDTLSIGDELLRAEHGNDSARAFRSVQHVVRWDPARVLAECEAKRRIVERYGYLYEHGDSGDMRWVLPLLALPYASHPDYDPVWRP